MNITPDLINGIFELAGSLFILNHCKVLYKHKMVRGVSLLSTFWFLIWGCWNVYYYPHLEQPISTIGGISLMASNLMYVLMIIYYKRNDKNDYL
jgi:predicted membrane channel-forming protein YqfA (hemolysin III family)